MRVSLRGLSGGVARDIWRVRQIQAQAYNWGVAYALGRHYASERIASPRNDSVPLTRIRAETGSGHSSVLQRGGFWCAVEAVRKWSTRRNALVYAASESVERTGAALGVFGALVGEGAAAVAFARAVGALESCRADQRRRVELVGSGENVALHLWATPPSSELSAMPAGERARRVAEATGRAEEAQESFLAALGDVVDCVGGDGASRDRLGGLVDKVRAAAAAEARADKRLLAHVARGDKRLFRTRRDAERSSGPALAVFEGCTVRDGALRLPGGTRIPLPDGVDTVDGVLATHRGGPLTWKGAVHIVDVTDTAGRVTRRTTPERRKYRVHFLCSGEAAPPLPVTEREHSLGVDWGVAVPLVCSTGTPYGRYASPEQRQANEKRHAEAERLQQSMSHKTVGSRRHARQRRRYNALRAKNTNVRVNHQRHVAKAIVTTPGVRQVVLEDTKLANMTASARGTKTFPTTNSAAKRGLNRRIAETAPERQAALIERAATLASTATVRVNPAYTSLTCFVCGERGQRETQALFSCPQCGSHTQADVQAALNTNEKANPELYPARDATNGGRDSRRKMLNDAVRVFHDSASANKSVTNKYTQAAQRSLRYIRPNPCAIPAAAKLG